MVRVRESVSMFVSTYPQPPEQEMREWMKAIRSANISLLSQGKAVELEVSTSKRDKKKKKPQTTMEHRYELLHLRSFNDSYTHSYRPTLSEPVQKEIHKFQLEGYANQYFQTKKKGYVFKRKVPTTTLLSWTNVRSRSLLNSPHHSFDDRNPLQLLCLKLARLRSKRRPQ